jgi:hypothetical protein
MVSGRCESIHGVGNFSPDLASASALPCTVVSFELRLLSMVRHFSRDRLASAFIYAHGYVPEHRACTPAMAAAAVASHATVVGFYR